MCTEAVTHHWNACPYIVTRKAFRILKTDLDIFPMRVRKESTIKGMLFIFFISLIIRTALIRGIISSVLMKKYSLESMILELERTREQKDLL